MLGDAAGSEGEPSGGGAVGLRAGSGARRAGESPLSRASLGVMSQSRGDEEPSSPRWGVREEVLPAEDEQTGRSSPVSSPGSTQAAQASAPRGR